VVQEYTPIDTWVKAWMAKKLKTKLGARVIVSVPNQFGMGGAGLNQFGKAAGKRGKNGESDKAEIDYLPQENVGIRFWFKGYLCWITNSKEQQSSQINGGGAVALHKVVIVAMFGGRDIITQLIQEAQELYNEELKSKTVIRSAGSGLGWGGGQQWQEMGARPSRPFDTVVLETGVANDLKEDVASFLDSAEWYYSRGVPCELTLPPLPFYPEVDPDPQHMVSLLVQWHVRSCCGCILI
jgi:hypothetical protein